MELDTTAPASSSGRVVDPVTGKELVYDLSKVVDYDSTNDKKLEEYAIYVEDVFRYYREREVWANKNSFLRTHHCSLPNFSNYLH
jgi:hypothetical protein